MNHRVLVLEKDPKVAGFLASGLRSHFSVQIIQSRDELREQVIKERPEALVLDIERWRLSDVQNVHRDFPALPIVCTHRVPDEEMWMAALEAGASDVCAADDVQNLLASVLRSMALSRTAAA
jgi:DNA-binding response OmpR family regulator